MAPATWRVGTITVPGSTGSQAITGFGGTPKAIFFWGANWLTEDTAITSSGAAVFRGMTAEFVGSSSIARHAASVAPAGDAHSTTNLACIHCLDAGGGTGLRYAADITSYDADGFTITWSTVTSGGYKVVYAALMDVTNADLVGGAGNNTFTMGYKAGSSLVQGTLDGFVTAENDRSKEFYGGAAYPGTSSPSWMGAGLTAFTFPTATGQQYNIGIYNDAPTTNIANGGAFSGPFLATSNVIAFPTGSGLTNFRLDPQSATNFAVAVVWDDEDNATGRLTPSASTSGTVSVTGLPFEPGLVTGYSIGDEPDGQASGSVRGAVGFSVVTRSFQWTCLADGGGTRGAFQSFQRGVVDSVVGSNVHAGTVDLTDDGFVVTTQEDDTTQQDWVWHAFGHPSPTTAGWIPQSYRRRQW